MCRTSLAESLRLKSRAIDRRTLPRFSFRELVSFILKATVLIARGVAYALSRSVVVRKDTSVGAVATVSGVITLHSVLGLEINLLPLLLLQTIDLSIRLLEVVRQRTTRPCKLQFPLALTLQLLLYNKVSPLPLSPGRTTLLLKSYLQGLFAGVILVVI